MPSTPAPPDPLTVANGMLGRGDYAGAARAYEEIARGAEGTRATEFRAMAALAYQEAGDTASVVSSEASVEMDAGCA